MVAWIAKAIKESPSITISEEQKPSECNVQLLDRCIVDVGDVQCRQSMWAEQAVNCMHRQLQTNISLTS